MQIGETYGRWTIIAIAPRAVHKYWQCRCVCGVERPIRAFRLINAKSKICRCASNPGRVKHGQSGIPEYAVWRTMKARVLNPNSHKFPRYGGRGIKLADRWMSFENFLMDMGPRPSNKHSIERKDNDGDYCPENCEWMLTVKQARNRRDTRWLIINGERRPFAEWCEVYGIAEPTATRRIYHLGWDVLEALTLPICTNRYDHANEVRLLA